MGLFDNMFDSTGKVALSEAEAFAGVLLGACACDGHVADTEVQSMFAITQRMKLFAGMAPHTWNATMDALIKIIKRDGIEKLVQICGQYLPRDLRETAFANACDIIMADGVVDRDETQYLDYLKTALGMDGDTALTIVEVMKIKNKG